MVKSILNLYSWQHVYRDSVLYNIFDILFLQDYQRQGNGEGSSSSIVPIFNTKRKRIKQALYSNPSSSQENKSSFSNSASQFSSGFKSKFNATQERQTENSLNSTSLPKNNHESTYTRPMQIKPEVKKQDKSAPKNLPCMPKPRYITCHYY